MKSKEQKVKEAVERAKVYWDFQVKAGHFPKNDYPFRSREEYVNHFRPKKDRLD